MARFYGTLRGNRGEATRMGTPTSGLTTYAAGWRGAIRVRVFASGDVDRFIVERVPWMSSGGRTTVLAHGVLNANEGER